MPVVLALNEIVQFTSVSHFGDQAGLFTWHYRVSAQVGDITDQQYLDAWMALWPYQSALKSTFSDEATYDGTLAQIIWPIRFTAVSNTVGAGVGSEVNSGLPRQVSGIITKRSNFADRSGRGRVYIPFPSSTYLSPSGDNTDIPTAAYIPFLEDIGEAISTEQPVTIGGSSVTLTPIIYHRMDPSLSKDITSFLVRRRWATQRRRGDYGQPNLPIL